MAATDGVCDRHLVPLDVRIPFEEYFREVRVASEFDTQEQENINTHMSGPVERISKAAGPLLDRAKEHEDAGKPDWALYFTLRYVTVLVDYLPKHKQYATLSADRRNSLRGQVVRAFDSVEGPLKSSLKRQYEQRMLRVQEMEDERERVRREDEERHKRAMEEAARIAERRREEEEEQQRWLEDQRRQQEEFEQRKEEEAAQMRRRQAAYEAQKARREVESKERKRELVILQWLFKDHTGAYQGVPQPKRGLVNLGNTCYLNSVLQALFGTPVAQFYFGDRFLGMLNVENPLGSRGRVSNTFSFMMREMVQRQEYPVSPSHFKDSFGVRFPTFAGMNQQDANEFLSLLLEVLHEDINKARGSSAKLAQAPPDPGPSKTDAEFAQVCLQSAERTSKSAISDMFGWLEGSKTTCPLCGFKSRGYMQQLGIVLPVDTRFGVCTLYDCFARYLAVEMLSKENQWECPACKRGVRAKRQTSIWTAPEVLAITLKRFRTEHNLADKITQPVYFPPELDLTPLIAGPCEYMTEYKLVSVVNHEGGAGGGHYTSDVLGHNDGQWARYSDDHPVGAPDSPDFSQGYLLFYRRLPYAKAAPPRGVKARAKGPAVEEGEQAPPGWVREQVRALEITEQSFETGASSPIHADPVVVRRSSTPPPA